MNRVNQHVNSLSWEGGGGTKVSSCGESSYDTFQAECHHQLACSSPMKYLPKVPRRLQEISIFYEKIHLDIYTFESLVTVKGGEWKP